MNWTSLVFSRINSMQLVQQRMNRVEFNWNGNDNSQTISVDTISRIWLVWLVFRWHWPFFSFFFFLPLYILIFLSVTFFPCTCVCVNMCNCQWAFNSDKLPVNIFENTSRNTSICLMDVYESGRLFKKKRKKPLIKTTTLIVFQIWRLATRIWIRSELSRSISHLK